MKNATKNSTTYQAKLNVPYVDKDENYRPQWYAELTYNNQVPYREAYIDKAIEGTLSPYQVIKRKKQLDDLMLSKQLYKAFRDKVMSKQTKKTWRDNVKFIL